MHAYAFYRRFIFSCIALIFIGTSNENNLYAQKKTTASGQAYVVVIQDLQKAQKSLFQIIKTTSYSTQDISTTYVKMAGIIIFNDIDALVDSIINSTHYDAKNKYFLLVKVQRLIAIYQQLYTESSVSVMTLKRAIEAFHLIIQVAENELDWETLIKQSEPELKRCIYELFSYKHSVKKYRDHIVLHYIQRYPAQGLAIFFSYGSDNFDSVFNYILRKAPSVIFNDLASSKSKIARGYGKWAHPALQLLLKMRRLHKGYFYFPFYRDILNKKITLADVRQVVNFPQRYFRLLVKVHMMHEAYMHHAQDTPTNYQVLGDYMAKIADQYLITPMNDLHYAPDAVRFRRILNYGLYDLYYLMVYSNDNLYTSSFLYVYRLFITQLGARNGFGFLKDLYWDKYRKFIKTLAVYSHLYGTHKNDFLKKMKEQEQITLMRLFVRTIPFSSATFLEDAIDVAGALTGIKGVLSEVLSEEIQTLYRKYDQQKNKKAKLVYYILGKLLRDSYQEQINEVNELYKNQDIYVFDATPYFKNKNGLIGQVFFYGDEDSEHSFYHLIYTFYKKKGWKVYHLNDWIVIKTTEGNPISIYANKPFREINQGYLNAQIRLKNYFNRAHIIPVIMMHRGHSYFMQHTINQLSPHVKLVLLGGCGSYGVVPRILRLSPEAQLISTRQIGKTTINSALFFRINEQLRVYGKVVWASFWEEMRGVLKTKRDKTYFSDYIPPHKNLSAIFIKYYYHLMSKMY